MDQQTMKWDFVGNSIAAFSPLAECTKKLQTEQYIVGDFFRDWLCCELELEEQSLDNDFADLLLHPMRQRKEKLLEHDAFLAALYLDSRFNNENSAMLTNAQKTTAINHLLKTYEIVQNLEPVENNQGNDHSQDNTSNLSMTNIPTSSANPDPYARLNAKMIIMSSGVSTTFNDKSLKEHLLILSEGKRLPLNTNILNYWKTTNHGSDINKLVQVALAVPATQVSVERAFSALSLILTKLKSKLSNLTLNNIMMTKLNFSVVENVDLNFLDEDSFME